MTLHTTARPVPRWAVTTARLLPLLALPVCLWRLPIGFGFQMGMDTPPTPQPLWITVPYVLTLSLLTEACALLCAGLVRPWGETVPAWVPVLRGRRIPPYAVTVPAALAGLGFTFLTVDWALCVFHIAGFSDVGFTNGWWQALSVTVSGLFVLWGPLILALTHAYHRRRRPLPAR
ncbi:hypothetical protein [Streptomyces sp. NBC_00091]|uniref:hypothetical protein n=1 Tax=Streptomyces sp. NBC_00091 TaxID=2975648 RepID=UPI002254558E|nr:hypothetical protein [Streptomyces sp. NBC_00091]MCX5376881.1 hypothetical protein [Streptomyces sp. NBC_00091]